MNVLNKVIVVLVLLILLPVIGLAAFAPEMALAWLAQGAAAGQASLATLDAQTRWIIRGVGAVLMLLVIGLLFLEFRRSKKSRAVVKLVSGGTTEIAFDAVVQRLKGLAASVPQVVALAPAVSARGKKLVVHLEAALTPEANISTKIQELSDAAVEVVQTQMGLQLAGKPQVSVRHTTFIEETAGKVGAAAAQVRMPHPPGRDAGPTRPSVDDLS